MLSSLFFQKLDIFVKSNKLKHAGYFFIHTNHTQRQDVKMPVYFEMLTSHFIMKSVNCLFFLRWRIRDKDKLCRNR